MDNEEIKKVAAELARQPYEVSIKPDELGEGQLCYVAYVTELDGCMAQGETPEAALESLREARELYIAGLLEYGEPVPEPLFKFQAEAA